MAAPQKSARAVDKPVVHLDVCLVYTSAPFQTVETARQVPSKERLSMIDDPLKVKAAIVDWVMKSVCAFEKGALLCHDSR